MKVLPLCAAACIALLPVAAHAEDTPPGWGMAIAARVIGEKCPDALEQDEVALLSNYIASEFAKSMTGSSHGPQWWADLRDKLEQSYAEKYSDPANCTEDAAEQAEEMVEDVREVQDESGR